MTSNAVKLSLLMFLFVIFVGSGLGTVLSKDQLMLLEDKFMRKVRRVKYLSTLGYKFKGEVYVGSKVKELCKRKALRAVRKKILEPQTQLTERLTKDKLYCDVGRFYMKEIGFKVSFQNPAYKPIGPLAALKCLVYIMKPQNDSEILASIHIFNYGYTTSIGTDQLIGKM